MRIAIVGAGAIGGWMAVRLSQAGHEVGVVARGATLAAVRSGGMRLVSQQATSTVKFRATDVAAELGPQELVVLAVKGPSVAGAAASVAALLGRETSVLSAMNGIPWWFLSGLPGPQGNHPLRSVDPDGAIAAAIPPDRVIGCVVHASSGVTAPGCITHKMGNELIVGEPNGAMSARLERVVAALRSAAYEVTVSARIQRDIWYKLWGNMTMNPISALTGATVDRILDDELVNRYALQIMQEAADLGRRIGCEITESGEDRNKVTRKLGAFKTSMLRDVEAGRPLEIDALLAAPREIAAALEHPTPGMDSLHGLLRLFAAKRSSG